MSAWRGPGPVSMTFGTALGHNRPCLMCTSGKQTGFWTWVVYGLVLGSGVLFAPLAHGQIQVPRVAYQGDSRFAQTNFTDLAIPYRGIDSWVEARTDIWLEKNHVVAPYVSLIGSNMFYLPRADSVPMFFWQNYFQVAAGIEFYPANLIWAPQARPPLLRGIRLYAWAGGRGYYTAGEEAALQRTDLRIGVDYYYDNLFSDAWLKGSLWADASWRKSNFSHPDYRVFFASGNAKLGHAFLSGDDSDRQLFLYAFGDWVYASGCPCRWYENNLKPGVGISFYPIRNAGPAEAKKSAVRRVNLYLEWIPRTIWLGHAPPDIVARYDVRLGISFSTSNLLGGR